jgi:hypothetical protein
LQELTSFSLRKRETCPTSLLDTRTTNLKYIGNVIKLVLAGKLIG